MSSFKFTRNIAVFGMILMNIQYVPLEGDGVSNIKVAFMCLSPLLMIQCLDKTGKAVFFGFLCLVWRFGCGYLNSDNPRLSTLGYGAMFFVMYAMFYGVIQHGGFSKEFFQRLVKGLLYAYIIVLIIQQLVLLSGVATMPLVNLIRGIRPQSLSFEPSSCGRTMTVLFYAFIKTEEYRTNCKITVSYLWQKHRQMLILFVYSMIAMQSATAICALLILALYFFHWKYILPLILVFLSMPFIQDYLQNETLQRIWVITEATLSGDPKAVMTADFSGSFRIAPMLNIFHQNYFDIHTWIGYGVDAACDILASTTDSTLIVTGGITDFGIIGYLFSLMLVFSCCIKPFCSLMTLFFFILLGGTILNNSYAWGILMIFTCISYFYMQNITSKDCKNAAQT